MATMRRHHSSLRLTAPHGLLRLLAACALCAALFRAPSGAHAVDVYDRTALASVAGRVARGRELILFSFGHEPNEVLRRLWLYMSVAFVKNLQDLNYTHVIALAHDAEECASLEAGFANTSAKAPECAWSSVTGKTRGYPIGGKTIKALWVQRYDTTTALALMGYNVLMMDADSYVSRDVYPLLDALPWQYKYIFMRESPVNGGLFYLRNVTASSPSLWLLRQVERRSTLYSKYTAAFPDEKSPGCPMDQDLLSGLFRVAAQAKSSTNDMWEDYSRSENKEHTLWRAFPQTQQQWGFSWNMTTQLHSAPWADACPSDDEAVCERYRAYIKRNGFKDAAHYTTRVCVPLDDDAYDERQACEMALAGPPWLWSHGDIFEAGWDGSVAVTHLLGVNKNWFNKLAGSHVGRFAMLLAHAGVRTAPVSTKRRVYLSRDVVEHRLRHKDARLFKLLIKRLAEHADAADAVPVMPALPCNASWIERGEDTRLGYKDHRVVDDGEHCYPSPMGWGSCLVGEHYLYPFQVGEPRPGDDVLDMHALSINASGVNASAAQGTLAKYCPELFDVDL
jgi:hypothetical protein